MVLEILYGILNTILLNPLLTIDPNPNNPLLSILLIATIVALITNVAQKLLVDQKELDVIKAEMKEFQQEMTEARTSGDSAKMQKLQEKQMEVMEKQKSMMMMSFKPMIITFAPILLIFYWMLQNPVIQKTAVQLPTFVYYVCLVPLFHMLPFYGSSSPSGQAIGWLGWYILCQFAMSQIMRKFMGFSSSLS